MPHSVLSVTLAFGLVNLPVRLYTAAASKKVTFRLLDRNTGQRVRQQLVSAAQASREDDQSTAGSETNASRAARSMPGMPESPDRQDASASPPDSIVPRQQIIKGYEVEGNQYIPITADELKALEAEANQHAAIQEFVSLGQIDPVYFEKTYYLGPDKGAEKVYRLLARTLRTLQRGAIAKLVMRGKEKLVLVRPTNTDRLALQMLYYADEVRNDLDISVPDVAVSDAELQLAEQVVDSLSVDQWEPDKFHDTYRERVMALIERKRRGEPIQAAPSKSPKVIDLMEALRASLATAAKAPAQRPPATQRRTRTPRMIKRLG
ncbi:non-homologous end joining protein Ku [Nitrospira sp. Nam74]